MQRLTLTILFICAALTISAKKVESPNGKISLKLKDKTITISYAKQQVLEWSNALINNTDGNEQPRFVRTLTEDYRMLAGKRLHNTNRANEYQLTLTDGAQLVMRLYNDGIAFRYEYNGLNHASVPAEQTVFHIPEGTRRWMQQWADSYEGFFPLTTSYETKPVPSYSPISKSAEGWNKRWGFPVLLEPADGIFTLLTEANIERQQSASCLYNEGENYRVTPDENNIKISGDWHTPWRVIMIGTLSDIVESTLVTDVSMPCQITDTSWIQPGVVSWIYWAYNHGSNDYNIIKKYIDMAVTLRLPYVLIDAEWDEMDKIKSNNGKTIEDAIRYARQQGIKPLIWYNSSVGWVNGAPTPLYRLNKPEDREKEFAWCEKLGVAGVKIDFFSGDNQMNMDYCLDLLESAARHHLLVNFHGAPIPRGWQRTWPNLLSTEAVYGAEWYNNVPTFTAQAARHNATLPFTRNVVGPMDYTPCTFSDSQHPHITTHAHELALTVLFESALQHLADKPESYLVQPNEVKQFFTNLPTVWDETRLLSGYPGEYVVMARRHGDTWYIAGINGRDEAQTLQIGKRLSARELRGKKHITLFADGNPWEISQLKSLPKEIVCKPRGGFVVVIETEK